MILKILLTFLALLAFAYAETCIYIATKLTKPVPTPVTENPTVVSSNYTNIAFTTSDNFHLKGWFFKNDNSRNVIIFVQGVNNNRASTTYGTLKSASQLYKNGYSILLFDIRATGESDGKIISFGLETTKDINAAVVFAENQGFERKNIGIISNSLGAIAVIMDLENLQGISARS